MFDITRSGGILLHPTSLPGSFGIGEIGQEAHRWIDELHDMGQRLWQMLPIGPTGYGNSPYQSLSSFAGNPLIISIDQLRNDGFLLPQDLAMLPTFPEERVDFGAVIEVRTAFLKLAARRFLSQCASSPMVRQAFDAFQAREAAWLDDYTLFIALKEREHLRSWTEWPEALASRRPEALAEARRELADEMVEQAALQFFFDRQWRKLREKAQQADVSLIGDIPIFAAHDSADVWANPQLFELDPSGQPTVVAGVPPDYFSATGQRWGNPLYRWSAHEADGFSWWKSRMRKVLDTFDVVRIDHFRGFAAYWEIPATEETALNGRWVDAPGDALFEALKTELGEVPIIAEDLGIITPDVVALREKHGFPGMKVMQFAFGADSLAEEYIPENYPDDCVAYTGSHDNDTVLGLFHSTEGVDSTRTEEQIEAERRTILAYTGTDGSEIHWDYITRVFQSDARLSVVPLQDVLGLGSEARMNTPGKLGDFWTWRFTWDQLDAFAKNRLRHITESSGRI